MTASLHLCARLVILTLPCGNIFAMLMVPEARNAIIHTAEVAVVAIICTVGAIRTRRRWARILLGVVAVPLTLFVGFGIWVIFLIVESGPR